MINHITTVNRISKILADVLDTIKSLLKKKTITDNTIESNSIINRFLLCFITSQFDMALTVYFLLNCIVS